MLRVCRSIGVVLVLLLGGLVFSVASPAWACGCGAYVPDHPGASVADERALIAWDGSDREHPDVVVGRGKFGQGRVGDAGAVGRAHHARRPRGVRGARPAHRAARRVPRLVVADVSLADLGRGGAGHGGRTRWRGRRARPSTSRSVRRHAAGGQRPHRIGYLVDGQRVSASRRPGSEPRTVCRRRLGDRRDPTRSGPGRSAADGRPAAAAAVVRVRERRLPHAPVAIGDEVAERRLYVLAEHRMDPAAVPVADEKPSWSSPGPSRAPTSPPRWRSTSATQRF